MLYERWLKKGVKTGGDKAWEPKKHRKNISDNLFIHSKSVIFQAFSVILKVVIQDCLVSGKNTEKEYF